MPARAAGQVVPRGSKLQNIMLAFVATQFSKTFPQLAAECRDVGIADDKHAYSAHFSLLTQRSQRPRCRQASQGLHEHAPASSFSSPHAELETKAISADDQRTSALGQKRTSIHSNGMSALPARSRHRHAVSSCPFCAKRTRTATAQLLDFKAS